MAAAKGNQYARNGKIIRQALKKALAEKYGSVSEGLKTLGMRAIERAESGDVQSLNVVLDRLAGKAQQNLTATVEHTVADLNDSLLLQEKLTTTLKGRLGESAEPPKRTIQ